MRSFYAELHEKNTKISKLKQSNCGLCTCSRKADTLYKWKALSSVVVIRWVPVTTAWHILGFQMKETASRYGG
jgi:hypothetical protein